jgi:hypothetical protein
MRDRTIPGRAGISRQTLHGKRPGRRQIAFPMLMVNGERLSCFAGDARGTRPVSEETTPAGRGAGKVAGAPFGDRQTSQRFNPNVG